jgi:hypothetical protein
MLAVCNKTSSVCWRRNDLESEALVYAQAAILSFYFSKTVSSSGRFAHLVVLFFH